MSRSVKKLIPIVYDKYLAHKVICEANGIIIIPTSTKRTSEMQAAIWAQGRQNLIDVNLLREIAELEPITDKQNNIVTKAKTSMHQFGIAYDIAIVGPNGLTWDVKVDINGDNFTDYHQVGVLGESIGLTWGGRFKNIYDAAHFEYTDGLSIEELLQGSRPGYNFEH